MRKIAGAQFTAVFFILLIGSCVVTQFAEASYTVTYYYSGNIKTVNDGFGNVYTFLDENYWGGTVHEGRLSSVKYSGGDTMEYTYYGNSYILSSVVNATTTYTYYNEDFYNSPVITHDEAGDAYVVYKYFNGTSLTNYLNEYDPTGKLMSTQIPSYGCVIDAVDVDANDDYFVIESSFLSGLKITNYSPSDRINWHITDSSSFEFIYAEGVDTDGDIYVVGSNSYNGNFSIAKYRNYDGYRLWMCNYVYTGSGVLMIENLEFDSSGNPIVDAEEFSSGNVNYLQMKYSSSGIFLSIENASPFYYANYGNNVGRLKTLYGNTIYAYIEGTNKSLLVYSPDFSSTYGAAKTFEFYDNSLQNIIAERIEFDSGITAEAILDGNQVKITKVQQSGGTYWFLWGNNVYGGCNNVVIEYINGNWNAYIFTPDTQNPENLLNKANWATIGPVGNRQNLVLPELGDWWQYNVNNNITPEFPPLLSSYIKDSQGRVIQRTDHNDFLDTVYTYTWDYQKTGDVKVDISYDYDKNGLPDVIYFKIYHNCADYNLNNLENWPLVSQSSQLINYIYWADGLTKHYAVYFNGGSFWQKTIEYYSSGTTMEYQWLADPNPSQTGDAVRYEYDTQGRITLKYYDDSSIETFNYYGTTNTVQYYAYFAPGYNWQKTIEYYSSGTTMEYQWLADPNPSQTGDAVRYEYDTQGRITLKYYDDSSIETFNYYGTTNTVQYYAYFAPGYNWQKTIEYYSDGTTMEYQWLADPNPSQTGDAVRYEYDTQGRITLKYYDDSSIETFNYYGTTNTVQYYAYFAPGYNWQKTIEYWTDGVSMRYQWFKDQNPGTPGDLVLEVYDQDGNWTEKHYDQGAIVYNTVGGPSSHVLIENATINIANSELTDRLDLESSAIQPTTASGATFTSQMAAEPTEQSLSMKTL